MIHEKIASKIAKLYVDTYHAHGFKAAKAYIDRLVAGNEDLRQHLVPYVQAEAERRRR